MVNSSKKDILCKILGQLSGNQESRNHRIMSTLRSASKSKIWLEILGGLFYFAATLIKTTEAVGQRCSIKRCSVLEAFFNKVARIYKTLLKKRFWHGCFPANFAKFLRTLFLKNSSGGCFWSYRETWPQVKM